MITTYVGFKCSDSGTILEVSYPDPEVHWCYYFNFNLLINLFNRRELFFINFLVTVRAHAAAQKTWCLVHIKHVIGKRKKKRQKKNTLLELAGRNLLILELDLNLDFFLTK